MSLCTKLKATFSRLLFGVQPPRSDKEALDPSRAPDVERQRQRQRQWQQQQANHSTTPTLLTLPAEIRDLIYTDLGLRNNTFHLMVRRRIRHGRCIGSPRPCTCGRPGLWCSRLFASTPLLLVCRALHHETISVLYAQNTFDVDSIYHFAHFARVIGPRNLRVIRDLRLSWLMSREVPPLLGLEKAAEDCVRTLREDMGERARLTVSVCLSLQSSYYQATGLWAEKWWLEPLARLRGGAAGMEVNIVLCDPKKEFTDGGVAWAAFQEEVERLVQRGEGVQSPWVEFGNGFLCVPGRFGLETAEVDRGRMFWDEVMIEFDD